MNKKSKIIISVILLIIFILICVTVYLKLLAKKAEEENNTANNTVSTEEDTNTSPVDYTSLENSEVIINNGLIENEPLIDSFINNSIAEDATLAKLSISVTNNGSTEELSVIFNPDSHTFTFKDQEYNSSEWKVDRQMNNDEIISLCLIPSAENTEPVVICEYSIDSNYTSLYNLTYTPTETDKIDTIVSKNYSDQYNYNICTVDGDVTIEYDSKNYSFRDALDLGYITIGEMLDQGDFDHDFGKCEMIVHDDGGSTEYIYPNYTILKFNQLEKNYDFYIGPAGSIYDKVQNLIEKQKNTPQEEE